MGMTKFDTNQSSHTVQSAPGRQAAKSAEMQRRIYEGATRVLAETGYHNTSINKVVKACAITPGALQHHFPAKLDLMASTAEFLLSRSVRWFAQIKHELSRGPEGLREALFRSWREQFRTAEYAALLEILFAARTDLALKERITPALEDWRTGIERELAALYPDDAPRAEVEVGLTISRALMTGLLVHDGLIGDETRMDDVLAAWNRIVTR